METLKNMCKSTAQAEKMAAIENVADGKIMAEVKIMANPKIYSDDENPAAGEKHSGWKNPCGR
jgi:hypothetical protein